MNFILLFAFFASLLSVFKDFADNQWEWKQTHFVSISIALGTSLPIIVNFVIFATSDKPWKIVKLNLLKAILFDYFEEYMTIKCHKDEGYFCNNSSFNLTPFFGGLVYTLDEIGKHENLARHIQLKEPEDFDLSVNWSLLSVDVSLTDDEKRSFRKSGVYKNQILKYKKFKHILELLDCNVNLYGSRNNVGVTVNYQSMTFNDFINDEPYFECRENELQMVTSYTRSIVGADKKRLGFFRDVIKNIKSKDYKIGILNVKLKLGELSTHYKGICYKKSEGKFLDFKKQNILDFLLTEWSKNPEKGILDLSAWGVRRGTKILHCLNFKEIVNRISNGFVPYCFELPISKYYCEMDDFAAKSDQLFTKYHEKCIGVGNNKILDQMLNHYLGESELKGFVKNCLISLNSAYTITKKLKTFSAKYGIEVGNWKCKRLFCDIDYFFKKISFGSVSFNDKKIPISQFALEVCSKSVPSENKINKITLEEFDIGKIKDLSLKSKDFLKDDNLNEVYKCEIKKEKEIKIFEKKKLKETGMTISQAKIENMKNITQISKKCFKSVLEEGKDELSDLRARIMNKFVFDKINKHVEVFTKEAKPKTKKSIHKKKRKKMIERDRMVIANYKTTSSNCVYKHMVKLNKEKKVSLRAKNFFYILKDLPEEEKPKMMDDPIFKPMKCSLEKKLLKQEEERKKKEKEDKLMEQKRKSILEEKERENRMRISSRDKILHEQSAMVREILGLKKSEDNLPLDDLELKEYFSDKVGAEVLNTVKDSEWVACKELFWKDIEIKNKNVNFFIFFPHKLKSFNVGKDKIKIFEDVLKKDKRTILKSMLKCMSMSKA